MEYGTDYQDVRSERTTEQIETFFAPSRFQVRTFDYHQDFDYPALEGRLLSSSYTPQSGESAYAPMLRELRRIFDAHQVHGRVAFEYDTRVYYGQLGDFRLKTINHEGHEGPRRKAHLDCLHGERMASEKTFHMTPDEFRRHGHAVVDWIADYYARIESFPVLSPAEPGQIRASLPADPPLKGEPFPAILADIEKLILPGITHWQSPNFFAYFPSNASGPAILGDLLSSGLGVQGMLWATSPACTELETHVLDWLVHMLDLPQKFLSTSSGGGVIQDTASSASLCALLAARERATNFASNRYGCDGRLVAYTSSQAHSSLEKGVQVAGIGRDNLRLIEVDENFAMRPEALARQIAQDRRGGSGSVFRLRYRGHDVVKCD